jgi:hypothetical protein
VPGMPPRSKQTTDADSPGTGRPCESAAPAAYLNHGMQRSGVGEFFGEINVNSRRPLIPIVRTHETTNGMEGESP